MITALNITIGCLAWFGILVICDDLLVGVPPSICVFIGCIMGCLIASLCIALRSM